MNLPFFIIALFSLQAIYWLIGKRSSNNLKGKSDYLLAGKNVRFFPLFMTFLATHVGGGLVLGGTEEAYRYGWSVLLYPLGQALGFLVLGMGVGRRLAQFPVSTVAQIFEVVYRSPILKRMASALSVISLFMILVGQIIGSRKFLVAIGFSNDLLFILFWAVMILYTVRGGLKAVIATDISQAIVFSVIFLFCFAGIAWNAEWSSTFESFASSSSKWVGWLLMPLLFMTIEQDMAQRCFAGDSPKTVSRAALCAGVGTLLIGVIPVSIGVLAKTMGIQVPPSASVLMVAISAFTNPWVSALVGCAVLAAVISTASSLISAISSNLSQDFFEKWEDLRFIRLITAIFSVGAIFFAFYFNNVVDMLMQSYELSLSCLFVPVVLALFRKKGHFISASMAFFFGFCSFCAFKFVHPPLPSEIASILVSLLGYVSGELIMGKRREEIQI